jgi:hypothetical protein
MTRSQLQEFARFGARARLQAIEEERRSIVEAFPDLGRPSGSTNGASSPSTGGRKRMSPSQREAAGERMKAYWAKRRGEDAGISGTDAPSDTSSAPAKRKRGMSAEARKSQGERMRVYWANRRAEQDGAAASPREIAADASSTAANQAPSRKGMSAAARKAQGERMRAYWAAKRAGNAAAAGADAPSKGASPVRKIQRTARKK